MAKKLDDVFAEQAQGVHVQGANGSGLSTLSLSVSADSEK